MKKYIFPLVLLVLILSMGISLWRWTSFVRNSGVSIPTYGTVPDFSLVERSGKQITLSNLKDKIWVADFIFTSCSGPCPIMSSQMAELQKRLTGLERIRLVSFSVDPMRDTPDVLTLYADQYQADKNQWLFLTGEVDAIQRLAKEGFQLTTGDEPLTHSTRFILVDRGGKIIKFYNSDDRQVVSRILADIDQLLKAIG